MDKVKMVYGFLCGIGGILIGLFANSLNTILGGGLFSIGIAILVFSQEEFYLLPVGDKLI